MDDCAFSQTHDGKVVCQKENSPAVELRFLIVFIMFFCWWASASGNPNICEQRVLDQWALTLSKQYGCFQADLLTFRAPFTWLERYRGYWISQLHECNDHSGVESCFNWCWLMFVPRTVPKALVFSSPSPVSNVWVTGEAETTLILPAFTHNS